MWRGFQKRQYRGKPKQSQGLYPEKWSWEDKSNWGQVSGGLAEFGNMQLLRTVINLGDDPVKARF